MRTDSVDGVCVSWCVLTYVNQTIYYPVVNVSFLMLRRFTDDTVYPLFVLSLERKAVYLTCRSHPWRSGREE